MAGGLVRRNPDVIVAELDGRLLLLRLTDWTYLSFTGPGDRVWSLLDEPRDPDWIISRLEREYEAEGDEIRRDVEALLDQLREQGFLLTD